MQNTNDYLLVKEVAQITRLSKPQVYQLIKDNTLGSVRLPGCSRVLVKASDLQSYLEAGRRPSLLSPINRSLAAGNNMNAAQAANC